MKVLLVNPPAYQNKDYIREGRCMQTKSSWAALWFPLSLAYAGAFLRKDGQAIKIIDCIAEKIKREELENIIQEFQPQLVVVNTAFPSIKGDLALAKTIKKKWSGILTVAFGLYPTLIEEECLKQFPDLDFCIIGEPEWALRDLARSLERKSSLREVEGLVFREGGRILKGPEQKLEQHNLDELAPPARDLLKNENYLLPTDRKKFTLLSIGRGCPHRCSYCVANIYYGKKFRQRSVASVMKEIKECVEKYRITNFLFWGESFTMDNFYGENLCEEIIKSGLKIKWSTASRTDTLNPRLLEKMKKAGCILLSLGLESAEQEILNRVHKGTTLAINKQAIDLVRQAGINSMGHFIFGLPGETRETSQKTIAYALNSGINYAQFYCAIPYPKTELGELARKNNWLENNRLSDYDLTKSVMGNESLTPEEIQKIRNRAYRKFYFRPKMFLQTLREVDSWKSFFSVLGFIGWIKPKK